MAVVKTLIGNVKGPQGDKGDKGTKGDKGATGSRGSRWTEGTAITGTSTTPTVVSSSGISDALANDQYLNTTTGNVYRCTTGGAANVAKWAYACNIKGLKGDPGTKGDKGDKGEQGEKGDTGETGPKGDTPTVADDMTVAFTQAASRDNIATGEKMNTIMGKIKKWFADMTVAAFAQVITSNTDLMALTKSGYLADALAVKNQFSEIDSNLYNMLISLNDQQKNHTIEFADYDVIKIQFKDQSINNALFSKEYLRPASKQIMDSICLYNGTSVHELFFTVSFDPMLKYVHVSDAYICRVDVADGTVTSVTPPIIQAVFGMQCIN